VNKQHMMNLVAQRLNLSPDEAQALQQGDFRRVAQARFANDPMMMSMLEMMGQRSGGTAPEIEIIDSPPPRRGRAPVVDDDELAELESALKAANTSLRYLSQIFGACRCWGKNESCARCQGDGAPGFRASSDPASFLAWVRPGLRALGFDIAPLAHRTATRSAAAQHKPDGNEEER
jgi:hypothetical protein